MSLSAYLANVYVYVSNHPAYPAYPVFIFGLTASFAPYAPFAFLCVKFSSLNSLMYGALSSRFLRFLRGSSRLNRCSLILQAEASRSSKRPSG